MPAPLTVIITTYNRAEWLGDAIESVIGQTYQDWELLIYDDGSSDNTRSVAESHAGLDSRIRYQRGEHLGRTPALRAAVGLTNTPYFGILDDDDLLLPHCLGSVHQSMLDNTNAGMVYTHYKLMKTEDQEEKIGSRCAIQYSYHRLLDVFMTFHFRLIRRDVYDAVGGFDVRYACVEDYDLCLKISEISDIVCIPEILYVYRSHDNSQSQQHRDRHNELARQASSEAIVRRLENYSRDSRSSG